MKLPFKIIALCSVALAFACTDQGGIPSFKTIAPGEKHMFEVAKYKIGCAVSASLLRTNSSYINLANTEYNSITPENAMKFESVHQSEAGFNFSDADFIVNTAKASGKRVHGHALIWHEAVPAWVTNFQGDSVAWETLMKTHIQTVVTHFKGKNTSWDVVNEAFNDDGSMRTTLWTTKLGKDYIARAFQYAQQADPDCKLFYNDYGAEYSPAKLNAIIAMVNNFKSRGIPIHGIGTQMHTNVNASNTDINNVLQQFAKTGLLVHISELDIQVNLNNAPNFVYSEAVQKTQGEKYKYIATAYGKLPEAQRYGITMWNIGDADSWITVWKKQKDFPCLFDTSYQKKTTYNSFFAGIQ